MVLFPQQGTRSAVAEGALAAAQTLPCASIPAPAHPRFSVPSTVQGVVPGLDQGERKQIWGEVKREVMSGDSRKELLTLAWICEQ